MASVGAIAPQNDYATNEQLQAIEAHVPGIAIPRRRQLEAAGFSLTIVPADIDETRQEGETPTHLVERLARQKAEATRGSLAGRATEDVLLAADTIVWTEDGDVLGNPVDVKAACAMLQELSGRTHHVSTGVCLMHLDHGKGTCHPLVRRDHARLVP